MLWEERRRRKNNSLLQRERNTFTRMSNSELSLTSQLTKMVLYKRSRDYVSPESVKEKESSWPTIKIEFIVETVISLWLRKKKPKLLARNNNKNYNYYIFN